MLGLPLIPGAEITAAEAAFLSVHALKDQELVPKLRQMMDAGKPMLITDGLRDRLKDQIALEADNVYILKVGGDPRSLLEMDRASLLDLREKMLKPFGIAFDATNKVSLYLIGNDHVVIENFNDEGVDVRFRMFGLKSAKDLVTLPVDGEMDLKLGSDELDVSMSPRSMVAIRIGR